MAQTTTSTAQSAGGFLDSFFKITERGSTVGTEIRGGLVTFFTMSYIIVLNPLIIGTVQDNGFGGNFLGGGSEGPNFAMIAAATALVAGVMSILMGVVANFPIALAAGLGLNAVVAYSIATLPGMTWPDAMGLVVLEGLIILVLVLTGFRAAVFKAVPIELKTAISVGIGLFIAFIGLQNLGLVVKSDAVLVQLGEFTPQALLGLFGLLVAVLLEAKRVRGAILLGILSTAAAGILTGISPWPTGLIALPPSPAPIAFQLDIVSALQFSLWSSILAFMFVDLFDSLGTMLAVCREAGMVDEHGEIPRLPQMLTADALATVGGALLGTSTTTTFIESASGVADGGRTGLTAVVTAALFFCAAFFTPLIAAVPPYATAPALIVVGIFMMRGISQIDFYSFEEAAPAFLTFLLMPLTYSIATGLAFGFISYVAIKLALGKFSECDPFLIAAGAFSLVSLLL